METIGRVLGGKDRVLFKGGITGSWMSGLIPQGSKGLDGPFKGLYKGLEEFIVGL